MFVSGFHADVRLIMYSSTVTIFLKPSVHFSLSFKLVKLEKRNEQNRQASASALFQLSTSCALNLKNAGISLKNFTKMRNSLLLFFIVPEAALLAGEPSDTNGSVVEFPFFKRA